MTREEFMDIVYSELHSDGDNYRANRIIDAADEYAEEQTQWIPCSERLPNFAGVYLVTRYFPNNVMNPTYLVDACFFDGIDTWHNDNRINHDRKYLTNVVAWLEEPEPYKEIPTGEEGSEE